MQGKGQIDGQITECIPTFCVNHQDKIRTCTLLSAVDVGCLLSMYHVIAPFPPHRESVRLTRGSAAPWFATRRKHQSTDQTCIRFRRIELRNRAFWAPRQS